MQLDKDKLFVDIILAHIRPTAGTGLLSELTGFWIVSQVYAGYLPHDKLL